MYLLGIDIGTSSCKVALFTENGEAVEQSSKSYPIFRPQKGWVEQNPEDWWYAVCEAIKELLSNSKVKPEKNSRHWRRWTKLVGDSYF